MSCILSPANVSTNRMALYGRPPSCFTREKRSSSAAATIFPSQSNTAADSVIGDNPKMYMIILSPIKLGQFLWSGSYSAAQEHEVYERHPCGLCGASNQRTSPGQSVGSDTQGALQLHRHRTDVDRPSAESHVPPLYAV